MSAESLPDADKTAAPSIDLEKGGCNVQKTDNGYYNEKHESQYGHPNHDFRAEERDDIPAAVEPPHVAIGDYPDGGFTAWLVVAGVHSLAQLCLSMLTFLQGTCMTFST